MRTILLSDLITEVRRRADVENATDRHPDAEITSYINQSIARLYLLLSRLDISYYRTVTEITTANGTSSYQLPDDFWSLTGVNIQVSNGITVRARKYTPEQGPWLKSVSSWIQGFPVYYRLIGKDPFSSLTGDDAEVNEYIDFAPIPSGTFTISLEYIKAPQKLVDGTNEFDGQAGFEEWVILDAAIKIKRKDNLDASGLMADKMEYDNWLISMGTNKDASNPEQIQDVQSDWWYMWPYTAP